MKTLFIGGLFLICSVSAHAEEKQAPASPATIIAEAGTGAVALGLVPREMRGIRKLNVSSHKIEDRINALEQKLFGLTGDANEITHLSNYLQAKYKVDHHRVPKPKWSSLKYGSLREEIAATRAEKEALLNRVARLENTRAPRVLKLFGKSGLGVALLGKGIYDGVSSAMVDDPAVIEAMPAKQKAAYVAGDQESEKPSLEAR